MVLPLRVLRAWLRVTCTCAPTPTTFAIIPSSTGEDATARLICDVFTPDGQPFLGDPRSILRRVMNEADQMGFGYNTGSKLNFFSSNRIPMAA